MSYILHVESNQKFQIDGKTADEVKADIKNAGLVIGNVTVSRLVTGQIPAASGFELIETLSEEEQQEQDKALEEVKTEVKLKANETDLHEAGTTAPGVVTGGENAENADAKIQHPLENINEVAPNLPNDVDAPHTDTPDGTQPGNVTDEGEIRSPETSITEPAGTPVVTTSNEPHTESTLTQATNADGTVAAPGVAATDVNDVNAPAPEEQLGGDAATELNPNNAAAEQGVRETAVVDDKEVLEAKDGVPHTPISESGVDTDKESVNAENEVSLEGVDRTQEAEPAKDPAIEKRVEATTDADAIRRRMLGNNVADALKESETVDKNDSAAVAAADKKLKEASITPSSGDTKLRQRRHNKREDMIEEARVGKHGDMIKLVEEGVTPKVQLNYLHPDQRWFEFSVVDKINAEKPNSRTNAYIDLSPLKDGSYNFGLYVNGKSTKSTVGRVKVAAGEDLIKAINDFLQPALDKAGA